MVIAKLDCACGERCLFVRVSLGDDFLWNCGFVSCCGRNRFFRSAGSRSFSSAPKRGVTGALWLDLPGCGGDSRRRADQDWYTESFEVLAVRSHRDMHVRGIVLVCVVAGVTRMAGQWRGPTRLGIRCATALDCGNSSRRLVDSRDRMAKSEPHFKPADAAGDDEWRGRRAARQIFPQLRADQTWRQHPVKIFHAVRCLPALPRRHLQTVG